MRYLVGADSVHTVAAACDYLSTRTSGDDEVIVLAVLAGEDAEQERAVGEALNVARVRLTGPVVETIQREGAPATELRMLAADRDVDEILVGAHRGEPGAAGLGGTTSTVLVEATRPVVVLPSSAVSPDAEG
jgi:nucleotide-binding universal stress UspA family protein